VLVWESVVVPVAITDTQTVPRNRRIQGWAIHRVTRLPLIRRILMVLTVLTPMILLPLLLHLLLQMLILLLRL